MIYYNLRTTYKNLLRRGRKMNLRNVQQIENKSLSDENSYKTPYVLSMAHSNKLKNIIQDIKKNQTIYEFGLDFCVGFENMSDKTPEDTKKMREEFIGVLNFVVKLWDLGHFKSKPTVTLWLNPNNMEKVQKWVEINHDLLTHDSFIDMIYCVPDSNKLLSEKPPENYQQDVKGNLVIIRNIYNKTKEANERLQELAKIYRELLEKNEEIRAEVNTRIASDVDRTFKNLCKSIENMSEEEKVKLYKACCYTVENENFSIFLRNALVDAIEPSKYLLLSMHEGLFTSTNYFQENGKKMKLLGRKCTLIHDQVVTATIPAPRDLQLPSSMFSQTNIDHCKIIPTSEDAPGSSSFVSSQGRVLSVFASSSQLPSPKKRNHKELNPSYSPPTPSSPKSQRSLSSDSRALDALSVISEKVAQVAVTSGKVNDASAILISLFDHYVHGPKNPPPQLVSVDPDDRPGLSVRQG